jgi:predicted Zn-dependent protease
VTPAGATDLLGLCDQVLDVVGGRADAEVTVAEGETALTRFANSHIHQNVTERRVDVRLRLVADGRPASASTTRTDADGLGRLVATTLEATSLRPPDPGWPGPASGHAALAASAPRDEGPSPSPDGRAEVVRAFVDAGPDLAAAGYCDSRWRTVAFANSAGRRLVDRASSATVDGIHRTAVSDGTGWQTEGRLDALDGGVAGATAAAKARAAADPVELEPGRYEVVIEPACVADMLSFLVGLGFSAKAHEEGVSFVRMGQPQLDPAVNLCDDATDPRTVGLRFDAEGTPKRRVDLVRGGVPVSLLHDRRTAARAGTESTGHAVVGGETWGPDASDLFLAPGPHPPGDLVAAVDRGVLVTDFWYTRVLDPKTQVVTGLTRNGTFLIEGGRVTRGVRNLRFTQSYAEALAPGAVLGVGADARLRDGWAFVPSLRLASWNFTGGAKG